MCLLCISERRRWWFTKSKKPLISKISANVTMFWFQTVCTLCTNIMATSIVIIDLIVSRCSIHGLLLCFILLHISNGSISASLVRHVLYSANLMSAICIPHILLMVHRYIYSRYSPVFPMLYQLYHSLPFSTLNLSLSFYLSVAT